MPAALQRERKTAPRSSRAAPATATPSVPHATPRAPERISPELQVLQRGARPRAVVDPASRTTTSRTPTSRITTSRTTVNPATPKTLARLDGVRNLLAHDILGLGAMALMFFVVLMS